MAKVVGIRFKQAGQIYSFDPADIELQIGDKVVAETARGPAIGEVALAPREVERRENEERLKPILRKAQPEDAEKTLAVREKEVVALAKAKELVAKFGLAMTPLSAEIWIQLT